MKYDFTEGNLAAKLLWFTLPMVLTNLMMQLYNVIDTFVVGKYIGNDALGAVGASYALMVFLTSIFGGLCMGAAAYFSMQYGKKDFDTLKNGIFISFIFIGALSLVIMLIVYVFNGPIVKVLHVPEEALELTNSYLLVIYAGLPATFLMYFFSNMLRALGNSKVPLYFNITGIVINIILDLLFIIKLGMGVPGVASATIIAQYAGAGGITVFYILHEKELHVKKEHMVFRKEVLRDILSLSALTSLQQSVMNFGILMIQGLVNSFGVITMSAFSVAVKIDTIAYSPVQDFGNAFSIMVAQNYGAERWDRIKDGIKISAKLIIVFSLAASLLVFIFASPLMGIFVDHTDPDVDAIIAVGISYLRIEGAFYVGIGILFSLYGFYRAINRPGISVVLTVCSLGTRVLLAYALSGMLGTTIIWAAIPIGWFFADFVGLGYGYKIRKQFSDKAGEPN